MSVYYVPLLSLLIFTTLKQVLLSPLYQQRTEIEGLTGQGHCAVSLFNHYTTPSLLPSPGKGNALHR